MSRHPLRTPLLLWLAIVALGLVLTVLREARQLAPWLLFAAAAWAIWRATSRPGGPRPRMAEIRAEDVTGRTAGLEAEVRDLRRQVAKLEADAARHDQLVSDLEDAAGRPAEAIIASYRHLQRQYRSAAAGKTRRTP